MNADAALALALAMFGGEAAPTRVEAPTTEVRTEPRYEWRTVTTTRQPVGHTHTCAHGHTWDHAANPTHRCQFCGMSQYVIDQPSRMVLVTKRVAVQVK